jgi:hypothetical protein
MNFQQLTEGETQKRCPKLLIQICDAEDVRILKRSGE